MKRFFLTLMAALLGCGLAWADGKVSGLVTAAGQGWDFCNGAIVILSNDERELSTLVNSDDWDTYDGKFAYIIENVPAGTYTLTCQHQQWGTTTLYAEEETITVGDGDVRKDLNLTLIEGTYYALVVKPVPATGGYSQIIGARISCENQGTGKIEKRTVVEAYGEPTFYCKEGVTYEIVIKANGYKTAKETLTLSASEYGKYISMEEGQDDTDEGNAQLTGTVVMEGGGAWPSGVFIALTDASNEVVGVVSDLIGGTYTFPNVKLGAAVDFHLTTDLLNPANHPADYVFVENGSEINPVAFTMPADAGEAAVATKNLTVRYKGSATATLLGTVLDESGKGINEAQVTISNGNEPQSTTTKTNGNLGYTYGLSSNEVYKFTDVAPGTYTLTYSKSKYATNSQTYTLVVTGPDQTFVVPDITLSAVPTATLALNVNDADMGSVTGAGTYEKGTEVTATATAKEGYEFQGWKEGGETVSTEAEYTFTLNADRTLTAVFESSQTPPQPPVVKDSVRLTLNVNDEAMGTVTGAAKYEKGTEVTAKAKANEGYEFQGWKEGGETVSAEAEYTFTITADRTLTAVFESRQTPPRPPVVKDSVTLRLEMNDASMGTVTGNGKYEKGSQVTVKAIANEGYEFRIWMEGDMVIAMTAEHTFVLDADRTFTALFAQSVQEDSVTLTLEVNHAGMGMVQGGGRYPKGTEVGLKATAHAGYRFVVWMNGNEILATTEEYKLVLNSDITLAAIFEEETANEDREQAAWNVYAENQAIVLQSQAACQYDVYNLAGVLMKHAESAANEYRMPVNNSGLYIIRRISATGISIKKVMVR